MSEGVPSAVLAESVRRRVTLVEGSGGVPYVRKEYLARTPLRRVREILKAIVGRAASQREARALQAMNKAGVASPPLLGEGSGGPGRRHLDLEFVEGRPLVESIREGAPVRDVLVRVGEALRRAHAAGWVHGDLHEANVLVDDGAATLIDWQRAKRHGGDRRIRIADVARFEHALRLHGVSAKDRTGFLVAVLGRDAGGAMRIDPRTQQAVEVAVNTRAREFARVRTRRVMRADDGRSRVRLPGLRGLRGASICDDEIRRVLDAHAALDTGAPGRVTDPVGRRLEPGGECILKRDHRSVFTAVEVGDRSCVVKEVRNSGWRRRVADLFRGTPARRGWRTGHGLIIRGIATAEPLAWVEQRGLGSSWLIMDDLRGLWPVAEVTPPVSPLVPSRTAPPAENEGREPGAASKVAGIECLLTRLHGADVSCGDLQAHHVLLRPDERDVGLDFEPVVIGVDDVRFDARLGDADRITDLAALYASTPDRVIGKREWRGICESVARHVPFGVAPQDVYDAVMRRAGHDVSR